MAHAEFEAKATELREAVDLIKTSTGNALHRTLAGFTQKKTTNNVDFGEPLRALSLRPLEP